jgi:hypothetical protein
MRNWKELDKSADFGGKFGGKIALGGKKGAQKSPVMSVSVFWV